MMSRTRIIHSPAAGWVAQEAFPALESLWLSNNPLKAPFLPSFVLNWPRLANIYLNNASLSGTVTQGGLNNA